MKAGIRKWTLVCLAAALVLGLAQGYVAQNFAIAAEQVETVYFVSITGNDANPGTVEAPFATLERARDAIRELKAASGLPDGGVTVYVRGGEYELTQTFELNENDSGTPDKPIVYTAFPGESVSFVGGKRIDASLFAPVSEPGVLARIPSEAQGHVVEADLAALGITDFGELRAYGFGRMKLPPPAELFVDNEPQTRARWPNEGDVPIAEVIDPGSHPRSGDYRNFGGTIRIDDDRLDRWQQADQMLAHGFFYYGYANDNLTVQSIDPAANTITFNEPHHYGIQNNESWNRIYVFNLLEEIDRPGEYFLDIHAGKLYWYPDRPLSGAKIQVSLMDEPLFALEGASHVTISRFTLEAGRGMGIYMERGENNTIAGNVLRNFGLNAITVGQGALGPNKDEQPVVSWPVPRVIGALFDHKYNHSAWDQLGGSGHRIVSNDAYSLGGGGIYAGAGDRKTLTPGNIEILNNKIHDFNRVEKVDAPGILVNGAGNRAAHNLVFNSTHMAILVYGNDHIIEKNEIHDVVKEASDAGALYMGRNPSEAGNVIRHNFFHHIETGFAGGPGAQAIFLDDGTSGQHVYGNVFYKTGNAAVKLHGGKHNLIENNIYIDMTTANFFQLWTLENWMGQMNGNLFKTRLLTDVNILAPPYSVKYPTLATYYDENRKAAPVPVDSNIVRNNVTVRTKNLLSGGAGQVGSNYATESDPGFVDAAAMRFGLRSDSPVYDALPGFQPIPFEEIGLYADEYRTDLNADPGAFELLEPAGGTTGIDPLDELVLSWEPSANAGMYRVTIAEDASFTQEVFRTEATEPQATVADVLDYGKSYYWKVEASPRSRSYEGSRTNEGGPGLFSTAPAAAAPGSPVVAMAGEGIGEVTLQWPKVPNATAYRIYRSHESGSGYKPIAETGLHDATYTDNPVSGVLPHYYIVKAVNALGESEASDEIAVPAATSAFFADDFEAGDTEGWLDVTPDAWTIAADGDGHVLAAASGAGSRRIGDVSAPTYAVESKVRVAAWTGGAAGRATVFGGESGGRYELALTGEGKLVLERPGTDLYAETDFAVQPGEWVTLRLAAAGRDIVAFADGAPLLALTDDAPLAADSAGISYDGAEAAFDDFTVDIPKWGSVPAPWTVKGINALPAYGSMENGQLTLRTAGSDVWYAADSFGYVYRQAATPDNGRLVLKARLHSLEYLDNSTMAGIMFRSSDAADAANFYIRAYANGNVHTTVRPRDGESTSYTSAPAAEYPIDLMVVREGDMFTSYYKQGGEWVKHTEHELKLPKTFVVGIAAASHQGAAYTEAVFSDIELYAEDLPLTGAALQADRTEVAMPGDSVQLQLFARYGEHALKPIDAADVAFASSDPSVFVVDRNGVATAVGAGTATITASAELEGEVYTDSIALRLEESGHAPVFVPNKPWTGTDIVPDGWKGWPGSFNYDRGWFIVRASGADIWRDQDEFHYVHQPYSGDGEFIVKVDYQENTNSWAKSGIMVRETLDPGSKYAAVLLTPGNGARMQARLTDGGTSSEPGAVSGIHAPYWLKLERSGDTFRGYVSPTGEEDSWQLVGSVNVSMSADAHVGLAATSHTNAVANLTEFLQMSLSPENVTAAVGDTLVIEFAAEDRDGDPVVFGFAGELPAGATLDAASGRFEWTPSADQIGTHMLTFTVTDVPQAGSQRSSATTVRVEIIPPMQDKTALQQAIATAQSLAEHDYTPDSWVSLAAALDHALAVNEDAGAAQEDIDAAAAALNAAIEALEYRNRGPVFVSTEPWSGVDVGETQIPGSFTESDGTFTVKAAGYDIWRTGDQFYFVHQPFSGDGAFVARMVSQQNTYQWAKAGLMIRETLDAGSRYAFMHLTPTNGAHFHARRTTDASATAHGSVSDILAPQWLKLERSGDTFRGYVSADGRDWQLVGTVTAAMAADVRVGLAVSSHTVNQLNTSVFDNVAAPQATLHYEVQANEPLAFTLRAIDADGDAIQYGTAEPLPEGAALDPATGAFAWTPAPSQAGVHAITFTAADIERGEGALSATLAVTIAVAAPPADKSALEAAIADAESRIEQDYTADSWTAMQAALTAACAVNDDPDASQEDADAAAAALHTAIAALVQVAEGPPGKPVLSDDNGHDTGLRDGDYTITMDMWWGQNGTVYKLYENGQRIDERTLPNQTPDAQRAETVVTGKPNGTYVYTCELINSFGTTACDPLTVEVADANPGEPVLSNDNWDGDGSFTVTMNMWWGTNGTTYRLYEDGVLIDEQPLTAQTPYAQTASTPITDRAPGTYSYTAELVNEAGATLSAAMEVNVTH